METNPNSWLRFLRWYLLSAQLNRFKIRDKLFGILDVAQVGELLLNLGLGGVGVEKGDCRHEDQLGDQLVGQHWGASCMSTSR